MNWKEIVNPALAALLTAFLFYAIDIVGSARTVFIPTDAVVPFRAAKCPDGWKVYKKGIGKFIVGVGHSSDLSERTLEQTGGEEEVTLTLPQLPNHTHRVPSKGDDSGTKISALVATGKGEFGGKHARPTEGTGNDQPHENMPPFVALLYCIRV